MSRGKRNTDVTELHITLGWHRLQSPTQTLLLHSFGHSPASSGLGSLLPLSNWHLGQPSIFLAQLTKCMQLRKGLSSPLFLHGRPQADELAHCVHVCVCNAGFQQHTGMGAPATTLPLLDLGKNVCAQLQAMVWWSNKTTLGTSIAQKPHSCETKSSPDPDLLCCFKFIEIWQVNSVSTDLLSEEVIFSLANFFSWS